MYRSALAAIASLVLSQGSPAMDLLTVTPQEPAFGYGYGGSEWSSFTARIDAAVAASGGRVRTVNEITASARAFEALMVDQRGHNGMLSQAEVTQLKALINTGKRVLIVGENAEIWGKWAAQLLGVVGGQLSTSYDGRVRRTLQHPLTKNLPFMTAPFAGTAAGGTALFDQNFATLWGSHRSVLTVLDVNVFSDDLGNATFFSNVAWAALCRTSSNAGTGLNRESSRNGCSA